MAAAGCFSSIRARSHAMVMAGSFLPKVGGGSAGCDEEHLVLRSPKDEVKWKDGRTGGHNSKSLKSEPRVCTSGRATPKQASGLTEQENPRNKLRG